MEGDVQFDEPGDTLIRRNPIARSISGISSFFIKRGWAKDENSAQVTILSIAVIAFVLTFIVWTLLFTPKAVPQVDPDDAPLSL